MIKIRRSVYETNSSSSHCVCVSPEDLVEESSLSKEVLRSGVIEVGLGVRYGWEWHRYYSLQAKLSYLVAQLSDPDAWNGGPAEAAREIESNSRISRLRALVHKKTGCKVEIHVSTSPPEIDHQSLGVGLDLFDDDDRLVRFLFGKKSYVQTGNDNGFPPAEIKTDLGLWERYNEHAFVKERPSGEVFIFGWSEESGTLFLNRDDRDPEYAIFEDQAEIEELRSLLDGLAVCGVTMWMPRPAGENPAHSAAVAEEALTGHLVAMGRTFPHMTIVEGVEIEMDFSYPSRNISEWESRQRATYVVQAVHDPLRLDRLSDMIGQTSYAAAAP